VFDDRHSEPGFGLSLSAESREVLGLSPEENARVAGRRGRVLLLECGDQKGPPVPWDRDLVLSADVRSFPLADLLGLLHGGGKSGFLLFQQAEDEKAVYLSSGEVVFAESNLPSDRLGACLLRAGLLDRSQLDLAEKRYHPLTRFGKLVVELGMLTPRDLWNGVKLQVEEIVRSLFSYTGGWIHFWEGDVEPDNVVRLSLPTHRLIEEGLERRDELLRFLARLQDSRTRIARGRENRSPTSENERAILDALDKEGLFSAICHRAGLDPRTAARTIHFLQLTGHVSVEQDEMARPGEFNAADDDVVREAVTLYAKLIGELAAPVVALDGVSAVAERLNRILEESASQRGLLEGMAFNEHASIDPSALEHRALRLPGDRVGAVHEALGELVAYLEFELKNHPGIENCHPFLEAVDPLRAMLVR
jgi:hypothetical protein